VPWFAGLAAMPVHATPAEADAHLAALFDPKKLRGLHSGSLDQWYDVAIADPMIPVAMNLAGEAGIDAISAGLLGSADAGLLVARLDMNSARPLFALLFHPMLLEALVQDEARTHHAAWSSMVDSLEGLYGREN
jgi:hypothetical protein